MRYFVEVAQSQHVTRSAEKLHIAQPALTQAIHRLERELGVPLFAPKGRNIVLTEYGKYLYRRVKPMLQEWEALPGDLRTMAELEGRTIHLNVSAASAMIIEAIIAYKSAHEDTSFQFLQNAKSDLFDINVSTCREYREESGESGREFALHERLFLAVPGNTSRYAGVESLRLEDVRDEGFICLQDSIQLRRICDQFCGQAGFEPRVVFESDNPATVRNMIAANMGVGFWPEFSWGRVEGGHVRLLEIEAPACRRDIVISCRHNKIDNARVDDFFEYLKVFTFRKMRECRP